MGINVRVQRVGKQLRDIQTFEATLEKDLRECMRCRFFYGRNSGCGKEKCVKEPEIKQPEPETDNMCFECPYRKIDGYCFPCMIKLLGEKKGESGK